MFIVRLFFMFLLLAIVSLVLAGAYLTQNTLRDRVNALTANVDAVYERVNSLAKNNSGGGGGDLSALEEKIRAVDQRVTQLNEKVLANRDETRGAFETIGWENENRQREVDGLSASIDSIFKQLSELKSKLEGESNNKSLENEVKNLSESVDDLRLDLNSAQVSITDDVKRFKQDFISATTEQGTNIYLLRSRVEKIEKKFDAPT